MPRQNVMKFPVLMAMAALLCAGIAAEPGPPAGMKAIQGGGYLPLFLKDAKPRPVASFHLDERPVTNGEFLEFVRTRTEWQRSKVPRLFADPGYLLNWAGDLELGPKAAANTPVTGVSWFAARAYLQSHGKRLPSVDEWEYAGRADARSVDASKDPAFTKQLLEWYSRPASGVLPAADAAVPDFNGIRGLHGVTWEWVNDFNAAMDTGEGRSGGSLERDLYCAGGAASAPNKTDYAAFMRYALRTSLRASFTMSSLSFRGAWSTGTVVPERVLSNQPVPAPRSLYHTAGAWTNQQGETMALRQLGSHWQVLCMGYTSCQYACPRITADMRAIERSLSPAAAERTRFTFVSIDPDRDTPAHLKSHAANSHLEHWNFLTGDSGSVLELAAVLDVKYEKIEEDFAHSNTIVVLNPAGEIVIRLEGLGAAPAAAVLAIEQQSPAPAKP